MFSYKLCFDRITFRAFRLWRAYVDVTMLKKRNGGRSPIENNNNYISATRIPFFYIVTTEKYFTWVLIRMCTTVTSSDMASFINIGDEKHHLSKWLGKEKK